MTDALCKAVRGPLTWWLEETHDIILVRCSQQHTSTLQHHVHADGSLEAPYGKATSLHCGVCNETLPLMLAGWSDGEWRGPRPEKLPPEISCEKCGSKTRWLGGWSTWSGGTGLICSACAAEIGQRAARPEDKT